MPGRHATAFESAVDMLLDTGPGLPGLVGLLSPAMATDEARVRRASSVYRALALLNCVSLPAEGTFMRDFFSEELVKSIDAMSRAQVGPAPARRQETLLGA